MYKYECLAEFQCPTCKGHAIAEVVVPEPSWDELYGVKRLDSEGPVLVVCQWCKSEFSGYVRATPSMSKITLNDYPCLNLHSTVPSFIMTDDEEAADNTPEDPFEAFMQSHRDTGAMLAERGGDGTHIVNRMVFAHRISAMEAFLGDTMINAVQADPAAFGRLLTLNKDLEKEKFTLAEIYASPHFVKSKVGAYLRSIMWHNLQKANVLYKLVLGIDLFGVIGEANTALLMKAVEHRHDCVHRNGNDKTGKRLEVVSLQYVAEVGDVVHELVEGVQKMVFAPPA